ncbi:MAG: hypothetical protein CMH51_05280 [Myxococcales bacterium]|jgi:hypothetical protein|nr:hypothetical protein [Myxococcales bacterium]|tara:strand:- start:1342 stop:1779 length:438 start_codon:yes stop_codon:yes gene_type:complete
MIDSIMKSNPDANTIRRTLWILMLIPLLAGCGFLFVDGPPVGWENVEDPSELEAVALMTPCTSGKTLIYMDAALAAIYALGFSAVAFDDDWYYDAKTEGLLYTGLFSGTFGLAAVTGNRRINECAAFNAHVYQQLRNSAEGNDNR